MRKSQLEALLTPKKKHVKWDAEEWEVLAEQVHLERTKRPKEPLTRLCERAQTQIKQRDPSWRERKLQSPNLEPLLPRLREIDKRRAACETEVAELRDKLHSLQAKESREEVLDSLTDEEVVIYFGKRVIQNMTPDEIAQEFSPQEMLGMMSTPKLCGYAIERYVEDQGRREVQITQRVVEQTTPPEQTNGSHKPKKPRIAIIGCKSDQHQRLYDQYVDRAEIVFVDKSRLDRGALPNRCDGMITWSNFTSTLQKRVIKAHARSIGLTSDRSIVHNGGFAQLAERIEDLL